MHFLYPTFLFALLTLAIPILIHLFNFRKYKKVYFSNVQFLKEVQEQQSSRKNLKERLILTARLMALLFLVLAFTKPYLTGHNSANAGKQQAVSIFVDNSYSMQILNKEGALLDEAKRRAKEIALAYSINDEFQLLTQDFEAKDQRFVSRDAFNEAVDAVKISPQSRSLQQIITRQESLLLMDKTKPGSSYIISDFQKNMAGNQKIMADTAVRLTLVLLKANIFPNVAVDSVALLSAVHRAGQSEKLVVKLHNYAAEKAEKIPLKLIINGSQKALGSYTINARSVQYDTLTFSGLSVGWQRAELTLQDNPVTFDNQFYFSFNIKTQMPVLLIDGGTPNQYVNAVFSADRFFVAKRVPDGNVDYSALRTYPLVVLSDIPAISTGLSQQLKIYVNKGGSLLVFPSINVELTSYRSLLEPMNAAYPDKLISETTKISGINLQNQVFKNIFESFPKNPDLPVVKKYYHLHSSRGNSAESLMNLPGQPFLSSYTSGKGKIYVSAVALNEDFSNLPRHALFVPIMFRIALLSGHDQSLFSTIGDNETIETLPIQIKGGQFLKLIKGSYSIIPDTRQQEGGTLLYIADQIQQTGIYDLKKQDSTVAVFAFNDNRSESDLSYLSNAQLGMLIPQAVKIPFGDKASIKGVVTDANFGMQLWKLCIILALIFLAGEILLIRYYNTDKKKVSVAV